MVQQFGKTELDACAADHRIDLADLVPDYPGYIIGTMIVVCPYHKWVAVAQVPYVIWVSLATVLQLSITGMNWGRA